MRLSDTKLRGLKPAPTPYKIADGGGLSVRVTPAGAKLWRLAYRFDGKQKELALGVYPAVSLLDARARRDEAKALLAKGLDPVAERARAKAERAALVEHTFANIAAELIAKGEREGLAEPTLIKKRWFLSLVARDFGNRPITTIAASDVLVPLRRIEADGNYETATRLRAFVGQVFRYAIATARAEYDPTFGLKGALVSPKVSHRAAITHAEGFAGLVRAIWAFEGGAPETRAGLKLLALLYPRPGELRLAHWSEFDLRNRVWTIPAARTKMRREHRKPLNPLAVAILTDLRALGRSDTLAFPSAIAKDKAISENTLNGALRRLGFTGEEMTSHGFRASASSLLNESGLWNPDAIEAELAHMDADQVRKAYHRATYWDERVRMAEWWADTVTAAAGERA